MVDLGQKMDSGTLVGPEETYYPALHIDGDQAKALIPEGVAVGGEFPLSAVVILSSKHESAGGSSGVTLEFRKAEATPQNTSPEGRMYPSMKQY